MVGTCAALAVASLGLQASIAFDPWAWLVWGREVLRLDLDTTGGPSWKPLPVGVATLLAPFGDLAPVLWLVVARTVGLLAVVLTFRVAARFAGWAAGLLAAGVLLLTPDGGPRFLRLLLEGHSAPAEVALVLWAVLGHLDGRHRRVVLVGTALALLRPEAWPFVGLYGLWLWRHDPTQRRLLVLCGASVPVLWFGVDWWGSGDPWHGADAAQVIDEPALERLVRGLDHAAKVVVAPAWIAAGVAVASAWRRGERVLLALAGGALAWLALVVAMSVVLRYAALSRFLLPAGALLCVLAGIGVVRAVEAARRDRRLAAALVVVALLTAPLALARVLALGELADGIAARARSEDQLEQALDAAGGPSAVLACEQVSVERSSLPQAALAWRLDVALRDLRRAPEEGERVAVVRVDGEQHERLLGDGAVDVVELGRSEDWTVLAVDCPAAARRTPMTSS